METPKAVCQYLKGLDCEDMAPTVCTQAALCGFPASCAFFPHCSGEVSHNLINWPSVPGPSLVLQETPVLESLVLFRIILQAPFRLQSTQLPSWADSAGREEKTCLRGSQLWFDCITFKKKHKHHTCCMTLDTDAVGDVCFYFSFFRENKYCWD